MARARAIETRLEKLVPALDEYYSSGFLTREETVEVSRQRQHWEFRLVAKPLLLLDVRGAITYELGLENRLREYCIHTKLNLKHRWDIVDRIESIYKIGLKHLRNKAEHEALRQECVVFLKQFQRNGSLSNLYGEMMVMHPRRSDIWVEAAEWQNTALRNTDNARAILQQALLTMASEPAVWACALRVELQFVQRLLDGLLVDHREEARKARKRTSAKGAHGDGDHGGGAGAAGEEEAEESAAPAEPTAVIAPKLREENEALAHVLLDLALAKTVVEEAFEGPASGAVLLGQLLSVAGGFAFSREVMELAVHTALQKMAAACVGPADAAVAASPSSSSASPNAAALTIASEQQRLRVRAQWRHRQSIDAVLAHALALDDALVNAHATAIVDTAAYLADGGDEAAPRRAPAQKTPHAGAPFWAPSLEARRRAAVASVVSLLTFAAVPTATLAAALPGVVAADVDATTRFPAVRRAFAAAMQRLADASREGASQVCAGLLHALPTATAPAPAPPLPSTKHGKKAAAAAAAAAAPMDMATVAQRLLRVPRLDAEVAAACVTAPQERTAALVEELVSAAAMQPPARTRARHEAAAAAAAAVDASAGPVMAWSVVQLEHFLLPADRDALLRGHHAGAATAASARAPAATAASPAPSRMTAEDVVRFVVWWKEEEAQQQRTQKPPPPPQHEEDASDSERKASASQARRRAAVVDLLSTHGLLPAPSTQTPPSPPSSSAAGRKSTRAQTTGGEVEAWERAEALLLTRSTALQYTSANASTAAPRLPLTLWRVFSALETMEGAAKKDAVHNSGRDGESDSDDDEQAPATRRASGARLASFAAAGLYFLSGVPHSTLSRAEEWARLEGLTSLLRCRLASWLGRGECTRDVVANALRQAPSPAAAEHWIGDVQGLLAMAQRCQPLPRVAQTRCVLPFLEGVALYRTAAAPPSSSAKAARDAVQAAREAHEMLLKLYRVSPHPESFLPLTYDGTPSKTLAQDAAAVVGKASTAAVQEANAEDWVAYVLFERAVSKDLLKAKTVVEQARRAALAPQLFMVRLNAL